METIKFRLEGVAPLIMHNGNLANPLNPTVKKMKKITSKRGKTDADLEALGKLEFTGGLYMGDNGPVLTSDVIEATLQYGARKFKEGKVQKMSMFADDADLEYNGPRTATELFNDKKFVFQSMVKVGASKVLRTRPIFKKWAATIVVHYNEDLVDEERIVEWVQAAGDQVGLLEWRPKYGRFTSKVVK